MECDKKQGLYSPSGASVCTYCYLGLVSELQCSGCGKGQYYYDANPEDNIYGICLLCPLGKINDYNNSAKSADDCKLCPYPSLIAPYNNKGLFCSRANIGEIRDPLNSAITKKCAPGTYRGINDTDCVACEPGKYSNVAGLGACIYAQ